MKQQKKGKKFLSVIILLFIVGGCMNFVFNDDSNDKKEDSKTTTSTAALTEEDKQIYKTEVYNNMQLYLAQYDANIEDLNNTIKAISEGTIDSYEAYKQVVNCQNNFKNCWRNLSTIQAPDFLKGENEELFNKAKNDIVDAVMNRETATKKLAKMLDQGFSNSAMKEIEDLNNYSNQEIISGVTAKTSLDLKMGIKQEEK